jgi:hypothetical protein
MLSSRTPQRATPKHMCELVHFKQELMDLAQRTEQPKPQVRYQHDNPWSEYEHKKKELQGKGLKPKQYEAEIRRISEELGI